MVVYAKEMTPPFSIFQLFFRAMAFSFLPKAAAAPSSAAAGTPASSTSTVSHSPRTGPCSVRTLSLILMFRVSGGDTAAFVGKPLRIAGLPSRSRVMTPTILGGGFPRFARHRRNVNSRGRCSMSPISERTESVMPVPGGGEDHNHQKPEKEERIELAAEVVGAVTKAAVGVAVNRAAATVSVEQGIQPPERPASSGPKRKALAGLLSNLVTFLLSSETTSRRKTRDAASKRRAPRRLKSAAASSSPASNGENTVTGVMVNGYWFPSLAAAAEAPAGEGFDFSEAAAGAVSAEQQRQKDSEAERRRQTKASGGVDFSCGAVLLSAPTLYGAPEVSEGDSGAVTGKRVALPLWRRLAVTVAERTGILPRIQQTVRGSVPRMPREALLLVVSVAGGELAKREIAAQVEALEEPVRGPAWALLNETYRNAETLGSELVQSNWDFASLVTRELADWKRRGVGNSYQEVLLKEVIELQTRALLRPIILPADEGSIMVQLNATYKNVEESFGRLLPKQTKEQLSLLEGLVRKLEDKGIGELSFDEVYRALLLGAVPPTLVTDAVRLLAAGLPGESGGAGFLTGEALGYYGRESSGNVTLAALAARLNDTQALTRAMTYTALAAETEVIDSLREVLDGLQGNIRKSLLDMESELIQQSAPPAQYSALQGAASYINHAARSVVTFAINGFNGASEVFDASFEALAEPSRRTLVKSSELFPWHVWYDAWNNLTKGEGGTNDMEDPLSPSVEATPEYHGSGGGVDVSMVSESHFTSVDRAVTAVRTTTAYQPPAAKASQAWAVSWSAGKSGSASRTAGVKMLPSDVISASSGKSDDCLLEKSGGGSASAGGWVGQSSRKRTRGADGENRPASPVGKTHDTGSGVAHVDSNADVHRFGSDTVVEKPPAWSKRRDGKSSWSGGDVPLAQSLDESVTSDERPDGVSGAENSGRIRCRG